MSRRLQTVCDLARLVVPAFILAAPLTYFAMKAWLGNFAYSTSISAFTFIFAFLAAILIAVLTVGGQALKAAVEDPVKSLRYE